MNPFSASHDEGRDPALEALASAWRSAPPEPDLAGFVTPEIGADAERLLQLVRFDALERRKRNLQWKIEHYRSILPDLTGPGSPAAALLIAMELGLEGASPESLKARLDPSHHKLIDRLAARREELEAEAAASVDEHERTTASDLPPTEVGAGVGESQREHGGQSSEPHGGWSKGDRIGAFTLIERLGAGGFGEVWKAMRKSPTLHVAIKVLKPGVGVGIRAYEDACRALKLNPESDWFEAKHTDSAARLCRRLRISRHELQQIKDDRLIVAWFRVEAQALAKCSHPNVGRLFEAGNARELPYIATEYIEGKPLTRYCDERKLSLAKRLELMVRICEGVQHAHQRGLIHRDLSPDNILVTQIVRHPKEIDEHERRLVVGRIDGKVIIAVPKIVDFGLAKLDEHVDGASMLHDQNKIMGKYEYMSPEQAGHQPQEVTQKADIFSLGVILYELISGTLPLTKEELHQRAIEELVAFLRGTPRPEPLTRFSKLDEETVSRVSYQRGEMNARDLGRSLRGRVRHLCGTALRLEPEKRFTSVAAMALDIRNYLEDRDYIEAAAEPRRDRVLRHVRKNKLPYAAAASVFVALVAGIASTTWQWQRAEHATQLARDNEKEARREAERADDEAERASAEAARALEAEREQAALVVKEREAREAESEQRRLAEERLQERDEALASERLARRRSDERALIATAESLSANSPATALALMRELPEDIYDEQRAMELAVKLSTQLSPQHRAMLPDNIEKLVFGPNGRFVYATCTNPKVYRLDTATGSIVTYEIPPDEKVLNFILLSEIAISGDGRLLAAGGLNGKICVWDADTREFLKVYRDPQGRVDDIAFSHDGNKLLAGSRDGYAYWYTLRTDRFKRLHSGTKRVLSVDLTDDGRYALTLVGDAGPSYGPGGWSRLDIEADAFHSSESEVTGVPGNRGLVVWSGFVGEAKDRVCLVTRSGRVHVYDRTALKEPIWSAHPGTARPSNVSLSPDGGTLAIAYAGAAKIQVVDLESDAAAETYSILQQGTMDVSEIRFLGSSSRLALRLGGIVNVLERMPATSSEGESSRWVSVATLGTDFLVFGMSFDASETSGSIAVAHILGEIHAWTPAAIERMRAGPLAQISGLSMSGLSTGIPLAVFPSVPVTDAAFEILRVSGSGMSKGSAERRQFVEGEFLEIVDSKHPETLREAFASGDDLYLLYYGEDGIEHWQPGEGLSRVPLELRGQIYDVEIQPKTGQAVFQTREGIWSATLSGPDTVPALKLSDWKSAFGVSPNEPIVVAAEGKDPIRCVVLDLITGSQRQRVDSGINDDYADHIFFEPSGRLLGLISDGGAFEIYLWDGRELRRVAQQQLPKAVDEIMRSETGSIVGLTFDIGGFTLLDLERPEIAPQVLFGEREVQMLRLSDDGARYAVTFRDGSAALGDVSEGERGALQFRQSNALYGLGAIFFESGNRSALLVHTAGVVRRVPLDWKSMREELRRWPIAELSQRERDAYHP